MNELKNAAQRFTQMLSDDYLRSAYEEIMTSDGAGNGEYIDSLIDDLVDYLGPRSYAVVDSEFATPLLLLS